MNNAYLNGFISGYFEKLAQDPAYHKPRALAESMRGAALERARANNVERAMTAVGPYGYLKRPQVVKPKDYEKEYMKLLFDKGDRDPNLFALKMEAKGVPRATARRIAFNRMIYGPKYDIELLKLRDEIKRIPIEQRVGVISTPQDSPGTTIAYRYSPPYGLINLVALGRLSGKNIPAEYYFKRR